MPENFYDVLEIQNDATMEEIKASYRRLVRKFHPDICREFGCEESFKKVAIAAQTLLDAEKRLKYDMIMGFKPRRAQETQQAHRAQSAQSQRSSQEFFKQGAGAKNERQKSGENLKKDSENGQKESFSKAVHDFFEDKIHASHHGAKDKGEKVDGEDIHTSIIISESEAKSGTSRKINIVHSEACPKCGGRKFINGAKCTLCEGSGEKSVHKKLNVKIPPNVKEGAKIKIAHEGKTGKHGGKNGDLYLDIHIGHTSSVFETQGAETVCTVPVAPWEAALGASIKVPTPSGTVLVKIPPATFSGQRFRLVENGIKNPKTGKRGDFVVVVNIETPKNLTSQELELYEKLKVLDVRDIRKALFERNTK
ncbi:molecular chaperone DnaJ [Candidatus Gastranaerophilus sp. (ex Termes propinquus)]|nr:molecular chaperone DnaJ [Candidatus Gastranaerophilus sp. (ex Termes propinquus)]